MHRVGFEPTKLYATDLESAPVVHLGTCAVRRRARGGI